MNRSGLQSEWERDMACALTRPITLLKKHSHGWERISLEIS